MIQFLKVTIILLAILLSGCRNNPNKGTADNAVEAYSDLTKIIKSVKTIAEKNV